MEIKDENLNQKVHNLLLSGERLSVKSVWLVLGTTELRHNISDLRREGVVIQSEFVQRGDKRFKEYWMTQEDIIKATNNNGK